MNSNVFYADCIILVRRYGRREEEVVRVLVVIALSLRFAAVQASSEGRQWRACCR